MLGKLLKYDIANIFKFLGVFYILAIFFAILVRIFLITDSSVIITIIGEVCLGAMVSMFFSIVINNLMRLWVKFRDSLYGDEAYLTHTLPVDKKIIYLSKIILALITLVASLMVIALSLFISLYSNDYFTLLNVLIDDFQVNVFLFFVLLFVEFANMLQSGFTGIILGNRINGAKTGVSVLFGIIVYIVTQLFTFLMFWIVALFNKDIMDIFVTNSIVDNNILKFVLTIAIVIYTIVLIFGIVINQKLLKKGVNVD